MDLPLDAKLFHHFKHFFRKNRKFFNIFFLETTTGDDFIAEDVVISHGVEKTKQGMSFNSILFYIAILQNLIIFVSYCMTNQVI